MIEGLRACLQALAENADVLPASGGAVQQLLQPNQEEREDEALTPEGLVDLYAERPAPRSMESYAPCPPVTRSTQHLFRYFLDGSLRTYFICTAAEHQVTEPVILAEVGAAAVHRRDDGTLRPHRREHKLMLLVTMRSLSASLAAALEKAAVGTGIEVVDPFADSENVFNRRTTDSAQRAQGAARWEMRQKEMAIIDAIVPEECYMIVDGSVAISGARMAKLRDRKVLGVAKSFAKTPKFRIGKTTSVLGLHRILAELPVAHRTPVFTSSQGQVGFWYVRLWPQGAVDYPLMGVVKCDMILPSTERVFDSELVTEISRCLVAERTVTPHGRDARWHSHLYPIYVAEQVVRSQFRSPAMVKEWMAKQWVQLLRRHV